MRFSRLIKRPSFVDALRAAVICVLAPSLLEAQSPPDPNYVRQRIFPAYSDFKAELLSIVGIADPTQRESELNAFWTTLQNAGQVPYAQGNQYAFLYRGNGSSVAFPGDLNGWSTSAGSAGATNFAGTNLWIREGMLPTDARTDYKIVVNGNWILDSANPLQMWGGFGPNNELRMPDYVFPQETVRNPATPQGSLTNNITVNSTNLGYSVNYHVYTPPGYDANQLRDVPVVYVTDGHEYLADYLGSMPIVLDNLIAAGELRPTIAVFIDPRQPGNPANNRRLSEYNMNANFANFVANELVPAIDAAHRTDATAEGRTILGTSMGGLNAAYFGAVKGDVFQNIAPQSPAYNVNSAIYSLYQNNDLTFLDIFQTNGTLGGDGSAANTMANIWTSGGYDFDRLIANEGHSWGQWRGQLDSILISLIGPPLIGDYNQDRQVDTADYVVWRKNVGAAGLPNRDPNNSGPIGDADYNTWRANFGQTSGATGPTSAATAIPEPATVPLFITAGCGTGALSRCFLPRCKSRRLPRHACRGHISLSPFRLPPWHSK
jgi:enterochelin esterase family protein